MSRALEVRHLSKTYQVFRRGSSLGEALLSVFRRKFTAVEAVQDVSLELEEGELVAFLGPNGAGKSTTLKMLSGILHPTSGDVLALGRFTPWKHRTEYVRHVGAVFGQKSQLVWDVPPQDAFRMNRAIHDIPRPVYRERLARLVALLDIERVMMQPTRTLSLGERMRCEFALALLHAPSLLFLDEPTIGLDIEAKDTIRALIRELNQAGTTVILTTHDLQDVEQLARRVIVIDKGSIALDGSLDELRLRFGDRKRVRVRSTNFPTTVEIPGVEVVRFQGGYAELELDLARCSMHSFLEQLSRMCRVDDLTIHDPPLEDAVRRLYGAASPQATR
ncbi:MAG: ATP-binding cassette domain-containing protein [Pseudomonadota bacterium]